MKRALKAFAVLFALVAAIMLAGVVYLSSHLDEFKHLAITQVEEATGRKLVIGEARMALSLKPEIIIKDVSLENSEWASRPLMVKAEKLAVKINLLALLFREIVFDEILFIAPEIYLETNAQGRGNWIFSEEPADQSTTPAKKENKSSVPVVSIKQLDIKKGQIYYREGATERESSVSIEHFTVQHLPSGDAQTLELEASYLEHPIKVKGKAGRLKSFLGNVPFIMDLAIDTTDIQAQISGKITRPMDFQGLLIDLKLKAETLSSLSWIAGSALPPNGPLAVAGRLSDHKSGYRADNFSVQLGKSDLSGSIEFFTSEARPKIVAKLTSSKIAPADFKRDAPTGMAQKSAENPQAEDQQGDSPYLFSDEPLPLDSLKKIDADISLDAKNIALASIPLQNLHMKLLLKNGLLTIKPLSAEIADGSFTANLIIDAAPEVDKVTAVIHASQVALGKLLKALSGEVYLDGGKTDIDLELSGQGDSARALASSLNGQVFSTVGEGQVNYDLSLAGGNLGVEILKKINPLAEKQKTSRLECMVVRFDIKDGVASTDKGLAFESQALEVLGDGAIDLRTEQVNILLSSKSTVASLLQIKGPLVKPGVNVNPVGVLKKGTSLGVAILTGGLSAAAETVFDRLTAVGSPCEIAQQGLSPKK